jgi:tRNA(Arg) A34 adenosine deaminase TadA
MTIRTGDQTMMELALAEALEASANGDVPVGAVVVHDGEVIARAHNRRECDRDPTAHAELIALKRAAAVLGRWRLTGCTLYVTLEPCAMCAGALALARIDRLVYGCDDPKTGACGSVTDLVREPRLNHRIDVARGVCADECQAMLKEFFKGCRV